MRLQGYFEMPPELVTYIPHGMVSMEIEMEDDPGMTLDVINSGVILRTLVNGNLLIIGAYNSGKLSLLDGIIPECFLCREYTELMTLRPELDGVEIIDEIEFPLIPNVRFAQ